MKEEYALLGTYDQTDRGNVEVIALSDDYDELVKIEKAIESVNEKLSGGDRENPSEEVEKIIEESLTEVDIEDRVTGYIYKIHTTRIVRVEKVKPQITKNCADCGKELFKGTEEEARHEIIYCPDCAGKEPPETKT
jgi:formylmethanofuran dehydrogenase subunit E